MKNFDLTRIDKTELQALGLVNENGEMNLSEENKELLSKGLMTDDISLKDIKLKEDLCDLDCRISLYEDKDNKVKILIHPYYNDLERNNLLSEQEMAYISQNKGTHSKFTQISGEFVEAGAAPYKNDPKQQNSYFVTVDTPGGKQTVWGVMLEPALADSQVKKGDSITIKNTGIEPVKVNAPIFKDDKVIGFEEKTVQRNNFLISEYDKTKDLRNSNILIEYDENRKSFNILDANKIPLIEAINGQELTEQDNSDLKQGKEILLENDIKLKASPNSPALFESNKKLLIASILLDGGMSFLLIKGFQLMQKHIEDKKQAEVIKKDQVNKMYLEQVNLLQKEVASIIAKNGESPQLKDLKTFLNSEFEKAEANIEYKNPQNIVASDDKAEEEERELVNDHKDDEQQEQEQEQENGEEQEQEQEMGQSVKNSRRR